VLPPVPLPLLRQGARSHGPQAQTGAGGGHAAAGASPLATPDKSILSRWPLSLAQCVRLGGRERERVDLVDSHGRWKGPCPGWACCPVVEETNRARARVRAGDDAPAGV
jgi:hypothetical protein